MTEIFKNIDGFEGHYQVSNLGRVKSLKFGKEKILKPHAFNGGYLRVDLCMNGEKKPDIVHRLVARAFIPNPKNLPEVNHRDEDKSNNCVENLEWVSSGENINFGTRNLRVAEKLSNGIRSKKVLQFTKDGTFVREWPSIHEVERQLGFDDGHICGCCKGKRQSAYNYIWRYR